MAEGKKAAPAAAAAPAAPAKQASSAPGAAVKSQPSLAKQTSGPAPAKQASGATEAAAPGSGSLKTGKVKWFNAVRGFGFITPDDETADLFVHQTSIYSEGFRSLREGEVVEYVVELGDDGRLRANNVTGPKGAYVEGAPRDEDGGGYYGGNGGGRGGYFGAGAGRGRGRAGSGGFGYGGFVCYACNQPGHLARDCNLNGGCYKCGKKGHFARDCPSQQ